MTIPADARPRPPAGVGRVVTPMATPFTDAGTLDLDGAQRLADHLLANGTETVVVCGTTGESPTLSGDETWELVRAVREVVEGRGTLMVGTGTNDTARSLAATERATELGADAILLVMPYYNLPDRRGQVVHFGTVAAATDLPVVLYDVPHRVGREIDLAALVELSELPNIVGVKDSTTNLGKAADLLVATRDAPNGFRIWSGADEVNLPLLAIGATGVVSVSAHVLGPQIAAMIDVFPTDPIKARELHLACMGVHRALFAAPSPSVLKGLLGRLGLPGGPVRPPLAPAPVELVDAALEALRGAEGSG